MKETDNHVHNIFSLFDGCAKFFLSPQVKGDLTFSNELVYTRYLKKISKLYIIFAFFVMHFLTWKLEFCLKYLVNDCSLKEEVKFELVVKKGLMAKQRSS